MERFNLIVIGGGSAGLMAAAGAAGLGAKVALVEAGLMGGDCLNFGCVPSKALIHSARLASEQRALLAAEGQRGGAGGLPGQSGPKWSAVAARVRGVIDTIAPHDSVERFQSLGVDVVQGRGRLAGPGKVAVELTGGGSRILEGRAVLISTGSSPAVPPVPGLEEAGYLTNETVFSLPELPRRLLVMGGGPIGCELGQALARLGAEVTLAEFLPTVLPREDAEAAALVTESMERDGVRVLGGHKVTRVTLAHGAPAGAAKRVELSPAGEGGGEAIQLEVDEILVATGRRPNLDGLGLEEAGITHGPGGIRVDAKLRTTARGVYACGDVAGPYLFTHTAGQQARAVIQNALLPMKAKMDYRVIPWCTFTDPEVARVGLNETEAKQQGIPYRTIQVPFSDMDRAVCEDDTAGFLKILTPPGRDDILGATLVGAHAGDLIHEIVLAMHAGIGLNKISGMVHIYPTRAEIFRRAADASRRESFTPTMQRMMGAWLRWRR